MKIWLQSGTPLSADSGSASGRLYEESLTRHLDSVARPGTELQTFGTDGSAPGADRFHAAFHVVTRLVVKSAMRAEAEGFDAVAVINTFDHGYYELRELVDIPVVFISEASMLLACQLAPTFSFVTHNAAMQLLVGELAKRYGVAGRMVPGTEHGLTYEDFPQLYEKPDIYVDRFAAAARETIARGATCLMVAGNPLNMFLIDQGVKEVDGVPILDCCTAAIKTAEMMVDLHKLGVRRSTKGLFEAPAGAVRDKIRTLFE
ncbi:MAG: aspartate/glutamate racemase family protein [Gammaproteobacteria bacterium]|jgi:Asp/Glu/hydantoin racemase